MMPATTTTHDRLKQHLTALGKTTLKPLTFYYPPLKKEIKPTGDIQYEINKTGIYATTRINGRLKLTKQLTSDSTASYLSDEIFEICSQAITQYEGAQAGHLLRQSINKSIVLYMNNLSNSPLHLTKYLYDTLPPNATTALYVMLINEINNYSTSTSLPLLTLKISTLLLLGASAGSNDPHAEIPEEEPITARRAPIRECGTNEEERWQSPIDLMTTTIIRRQYNLTVLLLSEFSDIRMTDLAGHEYSLLPPYKQLSMSLLNAKLLLMHRALLNLLPSILIATERCGVLPPKLWCHTVLLALLQTTAGTAPMLENVSTLPMFLKSLKNGSHMSLNELDDSGADNIEHFIKKPTTDITFACG